MRWAATHAGLFAAQLIAALACSVVPGRDGVSQSIAWFASGVGVAGLWLLGLRSIWLVVAAVMTQRLMLSYHVGIAASEALGSGCEALLGAWMLRRWRLRPDLARLRDASVLFAAAGIAPFASMLMALLSRVVAPQAAEQLGMMAGWFGWWRMNALGMLTVLPVVFCWSVRIRHPMELRTSLLGFGLLAFELALLGAMTFVIPPSQTGITALHAVLVVALASALRFGPTGANTVAAIGALLVTVATTRGLGPFVSVPLDERHAAAQVFLLSLVGVPLVFGALIAERAANARRWLRSEHARRTLLAVLPDSTLRIDADGAVRELYPATDQDWLLPQQPAVGRPLPPFGDPRVTAAVRTACAAAAAGARSEPIEYDLPGSDGVRNCEARCLPAEDGEALLVLRDVTARRGLEMQLRHAQKLEAVGLLAGGLAHDFNNLLTIVAGNAELLADDAPPDGEARRRAGEILQATERGVGLTRQLLAFSSQQVLRLEHLELGGCVAQLADLLRRLLGTDVKLLVTAREPAWVRADRSQIEQVVMNLAVNARDAMPRGGTLSIVTGVVVLSTQQAAEHCVTAGSHAELLVQDDGHGMPETVRARVFEPFFTTKSPGRGTGLGLATAYGIARQSHGAMHVDSEPGRGTTVRMWLPAAGEGTMSSVQPDARIVEVPAGRLLVVEDEPAVRHLLQRILQQRNLRAVFAADGAEALEVAREHGPFDLLVTDLVMPHVGGVELAHRLRASAPGIPVLFVSAHAGQTGGVDLAALAPADFLAKPFHNDELLARIAALLARAR